MMFRKKIKGNSGQKTNEKKKKKKNRQQCKYDSRAAKKIIFRDWLMAAAVATAAETAKATTTSTSISTLTTKTHQYTHSIRKIHSHILFYILSFHWRMYLLFAYKRFVDKNAFDSKFEKSSSRGVTERSDGVAQPNRKEDENHHIFWPFNVFKYSISFVVADDCHQSHTQMPYISR